MGFQLEPDQQGFGAAVLSGVTCPSPRGRRGIPIPVSYFPGEYSHHQATGQLRVVSLPSLETFCHAEKKQNSVCLRSRVRGSMMSQSSG